MYLKPFSPFVITCEIKFYFVFKFCGLSFLWIWILPNFLILLLFLTIFIFVLLVSIWVLKLRNSGRDIFSYLILVIDLIRICHVSFIYLFLHTAFPTITLITMFVSQQRTPYYFFNKYLTLLSNDFQCSFLLSLFLIFLFIYNCHFNHFQSQTNPFFCFAFLIFTICGI